MQKLALPRWCGRFEADRRLQHPRSTAAPARSRGFQDARRANLENSSIGAAKCIEEGHASVVDDFGAVRCPRVDSHSRALFRRVKLIRFKEADSSQLACLEQVNSVEFGG